VERMTGRLCVSVWEAELSTKASRRWRVFCLGPAVFRFPVGPRWARRVLPLRLKYGLSGWALSERNVINVPFPELSVAAEAPQARSKGIHVARASKLVAGAEVHELLSPDLRLVAGSLCEYEPWNRKIKSTYILWYSTANDPSANSSLGKGKPTTTPPQLSAEARSFTLSPTSTSMGDINPISEGGQGRRASPPFWCGLSLWLVVG